jgi:hypothetical protein
LLVDEQRHRANGFAVLPCFSFANSTPTMVLAGRRRGADEALLRWDTEEVVDEEQFPALDEKRVPAEP